MSYFDEKETLKAGKEALIKQAKEMQEYAGSLDSVTLNAKVEGVAYELCCHDVLGWSSGWSWFTVSNPDTESACYGMARAALEKFNVLIGLEGV